MLKVTVAIQRGLQLDMQTRTRLGYGALWMRGGPVPNRERLPKVSSLCWCIRCHRLIATYTTETSAWWWLEVVGFISQKHTRTQWVQWCSIALDPHGDGDHAAGIEASVAGFPRDGYKCCGTPVGMERYLRDSRGNVVVFDFYGSSASTKCIHCPLSCTKRWVLNYNDNNAQWNISFG